MCLPTSEFVNKPADRHEYFGFAVVTRPLRHDPCDDRRAAGCVVRPLRQDPPTDMIMKNVHPPLLRPLSFVGFAAFSLLFIAATLLVAATLPGCAGRGAVRTTPPPTADVKAPPTASRDLWQLPATVAGHLEIERGMTVIDLGAGDGYMLPHLSAAVGPKGTVIAVEIDEKLVADLRDKAKRLKLKNVKVVHSTASDLPDSTAADRILLLNTYPELADPVGMLAALKKRLKPGGWVVVIDYLPDASVPGPPLDGRLAAATITAECRGAGLALVASSDALPRQYLLAFMRVDEVSVPPAAAPLPAAASADTAPAN